MGLRLFRIIGREVSGIEHDLFLACPDAHSP